MGVPCVPRVQGTVDLAHVAEHFPDALEWFDWACPRLANADDLRFVVDTWRGPNGGRPEAPRLTALSAARTPEERTQIHGWWVLGDVNPKNELCLAARWDPIVGVWVRLDTCWSWRRTPRRLRRRTQRELVGYNPAYDLSLLQ